MKRRLLACALLAGTMAHAAPALRDPFARPAMTPVRPASEPAEPPQPPPPPPIPLLRAVVVSGTRALANIDGTVVTTGDSVGGWRVLRIGERSVTLTGAGTHITISLKGNP